MSATSSWIPFFPAPMPVQAPPRERRGPRHPGQYRKAPAEGNPWGLTACEVRTLRAYLEHGSQKGAAEAMRVCLKTVDTHMWTAGRKMPQRTAILRLLAFWEWDRARREGAA